MPRDARVFRQDEETLELVEDFRIFPNWESFDGYVTLVKEEANYWKGYGPYLEREIRKLGYYDDLDEGLALVKRATNLRQSIYNDATLMDEAEAGSDQLEKLEKRLILKSFEVVKLRQDFRDYLYMAGIQERLPYNKKMKEEKKDE
jgi:hypothetical protein